jgi:hypothetical protein
LKGRRAADKPPVASVASAAGESTDVGAERPDRPEGVRIGIPGRQKEIVTEEFAVATAQMVNVQERSMLFAVEAHERS